MEHKGLYRTRKFLEFCQLVGGGLKQAIVKFGFNVGFGWVVIIILFLWLLPVFSLKVCST